MYNWLWVTIKLGFSPNGRLLTLSGFLFEVTQHFCATFFLCKYRLCINFDKNGLGKNFGDYFPNSFGHPE
jgi:hypothetical protein